ncbi:hypothetical protein MKW98_011110 [Papaver atlanticum]|uniref:Uncharacterized protein n=1 Tax=Papaver atlanticum TaxID=357466 RepID=A0AAD4XXP5_9MAGN|nr:hypothetical protein MKW98_011110 [Papaver atlanticum]
MEKVWCDSTQDQARLLCMNWPGLGEALKGSIENKIHGMVTEQGLLTGNCIQKIWYGVEQEYTLRRTYDAAFKEWEKTTCTKT